MPSMLEQIDDSNFESEVLGSELPYLLDFGATWCAPCRALEPALQEISVEYRGRLRVGKADIDQSPGIASRFGVRGAPTLVLFYGGQERARQLGTVGKPALRRLIEAQAQPISAAP